MANKTELQEAQESLSAINDFYADWVENGRRVIDASDALEGIGEILIDAGYVEDEDEEAETEE